MNRFRPIPKERISNVILKQKNDLCEKFNLKSNRAKDLQDLLAAIDFQNKMPPKFFDRIIGANFLDKI